MTPSGWLGAKRGTCLMSQPPFPNPLSATYRYYFSAATLHPTATRIGSRQSIGVSQTYRPSYSQLSAAIFSRMVHRVSALSAVSSSRTRTQHSTRPPARGSRSRFSSSLPTPRNKWAPLDCPADSQPQGQPRGRRWQPALHMPFVYRLTSDVREAAVRRCRMVTWRRIAERRVDDVDS